MTESQVLKDCLRELERQGIVAWRQNTGTGTYACGPAVPRFGGSVSPPIRRVQFGRPGAADITGILPNGVRLEVECKAPGRKQSPMQVKFQRQIEANNGVYLLVHSREELKRELANITTEL